MTSITRFVQSLVAATIAVAIILAGLSGMANAAPAQQGGNTANVVITMPANLGQFDQSPSQSWVSLFRLADHKTYTGTAQTATAATNIGDPGNHTASYRGNREFIANGVEPGDYLIVAHFGAKTLVMNTIHSVALGDQYGPNQTDQLTWTGTTMGASSMAAPAPVTVRVAKAAPVILNPLCQAVLPVAKTGGKTYVQSGGVFTGKVAFVLATGTSVLSVEAAEHMFKASGNNAVVVDFTSVPAGNVVEIPSGAYQVFNVESGGRLTPLGFVNANPQTQPGTVVTDAQVSAWRSRVALIALNRVNAACSKYPVDMLAADPGRTGSDDDFPGGLASIASIGLIGLIALAWAVWPRKQVIVGVAI